MAIFWVIAVPAIVGDPTRPVGKLAPVSVSMSVEVGSLIRENRRLTHELTEVRVALAEAEHKLADALKQCAEAQQRVQALLAKLARLKAEGAS